MTLPVNTDWWSSLSHGGLLLAPERVAEYFGDALPPLSGYVADRLRRDLDRGNLGELLDTVLQDVIGLPGPQWLKGPDVGAAWAHRSVAGEHLKPRRVWVGPHDAVLPVFVDDAVERLAVGHGRRATARAVEWLRRADCPVALLTNGRQWRIIHANPDAFAWSEADTALFFEEGGPGRQLHALRALVGPAALTPARAGEPARLVQAINASRRGQAELSTVLGERVRQAVEVLLDASREALEAAHGAEPRDLYIAAARVVMRAVIVLFAEARELLPTGNPLYWEHYSLGGLREQLERRAGGRGLERLRHASGAWPRFLALGRLVSEGVAHPGSSWGSGLLVPRYGGGLFRAGDPASKDPVSRALAALEAPANCPSDAVMHRILGLLCRSRTRVRQGRGAIWIESPVDFSDLSSEYIGILYEGLLDFELRRAPSDEPVIFVNVGDQPALPFTRLNDMNNEALASLLSKLKTARGPERADDESGEEPEAPPDPAGEPAEVEEPDAGATDSAAAAPDVAETPGESDAEPEDAARYWHELIQDWAERAVKAARLVRYPKNDTDPRVRDAWSREVAAQGRALVGRVVLPGEWYLVRWGGTRKGAGTFYTRPQIAGPMVRRALEPLLFVDSGGGRVPRHPAEILAIRICDPAMGSGSFLVAALRHVTEVLRESLYHHGRLDDDDDRTLCRLTDGGPAPALQETVKVPRSHPDFDDKLRAQLRRHVVERCIYGVDLDPLAVELGRTALWIETMDRDLPFGFLDHKLKCGNALVGTWFDRFRDVPVLGLSRKPEGRGAGAKGADPYTDRLRDEMRAWILGHHQPELAAAAAEPDHAVHDAAQRGLEAIHALPSHDSEAREAGWKALEDDPAFVALRAAFDLWCAAWFWPADADSAPFPSDFSRPSDETAATVRELAGRMRFFHWELEFPDVFTLAGSGFDAIIGNPPWDIQKPNSMEFFSNVDPLYRTYGKQEALSRQRAMFEGDPRVEAEWTAYNERFKALGNWVRNAGSPFGDGAADGTRFALERQRKESERLHAVWAELRSVRRGYADPGHPFLHQGGADLNTYKMFLESG
ncbi:MAG: Eco57I restriction-modification methylase domain-containing protein, partial [Bradymonadia bacterium]